MEFHRKVAFLEGNQVNRNRIRAFSDLAPATDFGGGAAEKGQNSDFAYFGPKKRKKGNKKKEDAAGAQRLLQARSACCERPRREHGGPSAAGARMFDHPQG